MRFIGRVKLRLTDHEVGRLTLRKFNRLYKIYKDDFDLELLLYLTRTTYKQLKEKAEKEQEWF